MLAYITKQVRKLESWLETHLKYPEDKAPTVVLGYVKGFLRLESTQGAEVQYPLPLGIMRKFVPALMRPNEWWFVTHLQKYSRFGFLIHKPFCLHAWWQFRLQKQDHKGNWIPGTEKGVYFRSPGRRFDVPGTNGKHWIVTLGHLGIRWD